MHFAFSNKKVVRDYNLSVELMLLNCGRRLEGPLDCKEIQPVHLKANQSWKFTERTDAKAETPNTLATWCEEMTHWKRPWCWERLKAGGEGDNRGWDGWMASPTQGTWVRVNSRSWWWTGRPCSPWGRKESDTTERLDWTKLKGNIHSQTGVNESLIQISV